jgi:hypothetical protein
MFNRLFPAVGAVCVLAAMPAFAQDTAQHNKRNEIAKGAAVTIEGCVTAGQKADTFVLGTVKEVQAVPVDMLRKRMYWLDSTKHIKGHVGYQVRISGRVQDLERSEIEIDLGAGPNGGAVAKIEGPGGAEVSTPVAKVALSGVANTQGEVDVPMTLVKIKVDKVTRLAGRCS